MVGDSPGTVGKYKHEAALKEHAHNPSYMEFPQGSRTQKVSGRKKSQPPEAVKAQGPAEEKFRN